MLDAAEPRACSPLRTASRAARAERENSSAAPGAESGTPAGPDRAPVRRRNFARWRALSLSLVYLVFAIHIVHWKLTGSTLAPLELNEVMYTLELGIITAGFLFMCALVLGTLIFGRFFCSWACHIMVLQDLCAWLLRKVGLRAKPIRSRLLLLVPPLTAAYMFLWPQIVRAWNDHAFPTFRFSTDREGWASFVTTNFWRNLPGPWIIALTFLVCGFVIVYLLGSRSFCTYVCPYGAIFALADRFTPARIKVSDACQQCGRCTAACTSGVRVHDEVRIHGMVVNSACLKDLDCVAACPQGALSYGLARPALFKSWRSGGRFGLPYDYSLWEETLIGVIFLATLLSFRGLYSRIPFLLALALGAIFAFLAVVTVRLFRRPAVSVARWPLKELGRWTRPGYAFAALAALLGVLLMHSAFVRYHEYNGLRAARALQQEPNAEQRREIAGMALSRLTIADQWGLFANERVHRSALIAGMAAQRFELVEHFAARILAAHPRDLEAHLYLAQVLAGTDRTADAERAFRAILAEEPADPGTAARYFATAHHGLAALRARRGEYSAAVAGLRAAARLDPARAAAHADLGSALAELGLFDESVASLRAAVQLDPHHPKANYNLGTLLAHQGDLDGAIAAYRAALTGMPDDVDLLNNLGSVLLRTGDLAGARPLLERAVAGNPRNADARFNLGLLLAEYGDPRASEHLSVAASLDSKYARLLAPPP